VKITTKHKTRISREQKTLWSY